MRSSKHHLDQSTSKTGANVSISMTSQLMAILAFFVVSLFASPLTLAAETKRKVIIDQDAFEGPGIQPILMLLQAPDVEVLGITIVSGDGWQPEETPRTLRMLELVGRTDIPVYAGATYPIINSKALTELREKRYGKLGYKGAWTETWPANDTMTRADYHDAQSIPAFIEGQPSISPGKGSAAEFLIAQTKKHPGEVSIIAMGPLTNLALAQRLDAQFASRVKEVSLMGGAFNLPLMSDHSPFATQNAYTPRLTFNYQWDPEAAHIVHTSPFPKLTLVTRDAIMGIIANKEVLDQVTQKNNAIANYLKRISHPGFPLWDEVQAAVWLDPSIITQSNTLWLGVDLMPGANYGELLTWPNDRLPKLGEQPVRMVYRVNKNKVLDMFISLLNR